ncbi:MAG: UdgX family uracil-DNA binding protein [Burkholderiaceae bacterium]
MTTMNGQAGAGLTQYVASFADWRAAARALLQQGRAPHEVQWSHEQGGADLFAQACMHNESSTAESAASPVHSPSIFRNSEIDGLTTGASQPEQKEDFVLHIPRQLMEMLQSASCFRSGDRWAFLYRVVWRWQRGEQDVISAADEDGTRLHAMVKAVRREIHDMHAYVRFRERTESDGPPRFVAWYEPAHDVLPQVARHFAGRMGRMSWMIATPDATVLWDGTTLHMTEALLRGPADIEDSGEALWLTYYRSIFNPARLNTRVMQSHIPSRFWKNLPEGKLVPAMVAEASNGAQRIGQAAAVGQRAGAMIPIAAERAQPQREAPATLDQCRRCTLWERATQAIAGRGPEHARIMLVGEQPGDQEDIAGEPFVGPAGQLLDSAMQEAALARREVYLTNAVKHFKWEPRGKRRLHKTPAQREVAACRHWLMDEVARVKPEVIVAMGSTALKSLLDTSQVALTDLIGKPFQHEGRWIVAVYHPAYVLRAPDAAAKEQAFRKMVEGFRLAQQLAERAND